MASATSTPAASAGRSARSARSLGRRPGSSPTALTRVQEKDELRRLNDRLANYIQRVQELEGERASMLVLLGEKEDSQSREMGAVRRIYEVELADVRSTLDEVAAERARLQVEHGGLGDDLRKLQARSQKKEADLANAVTQWRSVELVLSSKEVECSKLLMENRALGADVSELQEQLQNLEAALADTKVQLNSEMLRRVDMENRLQTMKEQLDLQRNVSEQEILEIRSRHESRLVEVDSGRRREFESKLAETMQQLRREHDSQIQQYKEELERTFCTKLENAQQSVVEKSDVASATRDELLSTKLRLETLSAQMSQIQKEKALLEARVQDLELTLDQERGLWQQRLGQKEQELQSTRSQMRSQLEDYESLLDVKLALDMEINAYRKLLEVEEQRLHLSPSPPKHAAAASSRTRDRASWTKRGKKRKHEGASGSSPAYKVSTHAAAHGAVSVEEVDLEGNYIVLKNNSEEEHPLGGWVVRKSYPDSGDLSFHIPPSYTLGGGQTLTIWGAGAEVELSPGDLVLEGHRSWGPITNVRVILLNPELQEMAERRLVCTQSRDEETELEFDEECVAGSDIQHFRRQDLSKEASCSVM